MVGFFLAAYLQVPMMGIAIVGIVAALLVFKRDSAKPAQAEAGATSSQNFEGGFDGDE
ncbi:MAG: PTS mannose/fructose/sorbose/N-acetylgalactosamine transporter subunit IIC, partial [Lactococcus garvieae]